MGGRSKGRATGWGEALPGPVPHANFAWEQPQQPNGLLLPTPLPVSPGADWPFPYPEPDYPPLSKPVSPSAASSWGNSNGPPGVVERRRSRLAQASRGQRSRGREGHMRKLDFECELCHVAFEHPLDRAEHEEGVEHRAAENAGLLRRRKELEESKQGINVSQIFSPSWGCSRWTMRERSETSDAVLIMNCSYKEQKLLAVRFAEPPGSTFALKGLENRPFSGGELPSAIIIPPNGTATFQVSCSSGFQPGFLRTVLVLEFAGFKIGRWVEVLVENPATRDLGPETPYVAMPEPSLPAEVIIEGEAPEAKAIAKGPKAKRKCGEYPVPQDIRQAIKEGLTIDALEGDLMVDNYAERFATVLYVEEVQAEIDIRTYDMHGALMVEEPKSELLRLEVPGLAEGRPTLVMGDIIHARKAVKDERPGRPDREFEGHIHQVGAGYVLLRFHASFHANFIRGERHHVRFSINNVPYRRSHTGLKNLELFPGPLAPLILPDYIPPSLKCLAPPRNLQLITKGLNTEQLSAVSQILLRGLLQQGPDRDSALPPYVLFGPPGTGKTKTLVETVLQILKRFPEAKILACAPSNSAADNLLERLAPLMQKMDMLRLNSVTRAKPSNLDPQIISKFCCIAPGTGGVFHIPEQKALEVPRVVISTCSTAVQLWKRGVRRGHFSFILIDEAGHAMEPECIVPVALLAGAHTVVMLAGDPQQLGPVVRSPLAKSNGLGESWLERLCKLPLYSPHPRTGYNPLVLTKLVKNYRSHPDILKLPSEKFYRGELQACADPVQAQGLCRTSLLPSKGFPLCFHGVQGQDMREGNSPSWFNPAEIALVKKYVEDLKEVKVQLKDVGVVTPYRRQMQKLRALFDKSGMGEVKVGSVEEFQGQERRVIIISTVRSSQEFIEFDYRHCLGFLANPKRFNVAVTRAMQLLVCIGNPHVLAQLRGSLSKEQRESEERIFESLAALGLRDMSAAMEEEPPDSFASWASQVRLYEDPPWPEPA